MKRSDIGPFGVITLLFVLLLQVAAMDRLYAAGWAHGAAAAFVAAVSARLALTLASRAGVPAARQDGLGAAVAGTVPRRGAAVAGALTVAACAAAAAPLGALPAAHYALACLAAILAAEGLLRRCRHRLGGVTGDVFGASAETASTAALLVLALG